MGAAVTSIEPVLFNSDLQVLRGIAVSLVIFHHFGFLIVGQGWYSVFQDHSGGYSGVDLFFCISGFIIARTHYDELGSRTRNFVSVCAMFWLKRAFRLWPSAWLWAIICLVTYGGFFGLSWQANIGDASAAVFAYSNIHWWRCLAQHSSCGALGNYWSLSLEEQFYFLFPFLFLLRPRIRSWIFIILFLVQVPLQRDHWQPQLIAFIRTDAIALGILLFLFSKTRYYTFILLFLQSGRVVTCVQGALFLGVLWLTPPEAKPENGLVPFALGLVVVQCGLLVLIASYNRNLILNVICIRRCLLWIGNRSYSLYLVQALSFQIIDHVWMRSSFAEGLPYAISFPVCSILTFAVMAMLADINLKWVERPWRRRGAIFTAKLFSLRA